MDYLRFQSSACPISKFVKAASGCAPHSRIAVSISPFACTVNLAPADLPKESGRFV